MSFSQDTKNSLCAIPAKNQCCQSAELYGMLLFGNSFERQRIRVITENERTSELLLRLLRDCLGITGNLYISEKKSKGMPVSSYKVTVSASHDTKKIFERFGYPDGMPTDVIHPELFSCGECVRSFLRGAFLAGGTISDPESNSGYRLDISDESETLILLLAELLGAYGIVPKTSLRKGSYVVYYKESESLEDFLTFIGAGQAALTIMNVKIIRETRNRENRISNCDFANISKATGAAQETIRSIKRLMECGVFSELPEELRTTAKLRLDNPEISLTDLAKLHSPCITKSGVNHRLRKIVAYCERLGLH